MQYKPTRNFLIILKTITITMLIISPLLYSAETILDESEIKFAFYSSAWGENANDGLRMVAFNKTENPVRIGSIYFMSEENKGGEVDIILNLEVPPMGYAEIELPYVDLLSGDECIDRTLDENWKLVEISNYTLNPSVRNLIIEDTDSFRIYQCVRTVNTNWIDLTTNRLTRYNEWVLYHFERRRS